MEGNLHLDLGSKSPAKGSGRLKNKEGGATIAGI